MNLFLTGTDTGVERTHTAVQILRTARAHGQAAPHWLNVVKQTQV